MDDDAKTTAGDGLLGAGSAPKRREAEPGGRRAGPAARALFVTAAFVVVVAGMRAAQPILVPFLLALFLAVLCGPPVSALRRAGLPLGLALGVVIGGLVVLGLVVAGMVGRSIQDFEQSRGEIEERMSGTMHELHTRLAEYGVVDPPIERRAPPDHEAPDVEVELPPRLGPFEQVLDGLDARGVFVWVSDLFGQLLAMLANTFLILLTVIFVLMEAMGFPDKLRRALDDPWVSFSPFNRFVDSVNRYMAMKTGLSLLTGVLAGVWLAVLGVNYAVLWGLLAFLLNFVPNLGSLLAAVPPVLLALVQLDKGPSTALLVAVGYGVINVVVGSVLEPRLMGRRLGLSTLVVFLSLVFWGWVLGAVGMLLSVPLTMTVKIALESHDGTRWLAVMLGSDTAPAEKAAAPPSDPDPEPVA